MSTMLMEEEQTLLDLSNELEEVTGRMRRAVIDMVHRARDKMHEAAAKELDLRRKQQELEQQQLIEQLDNMQALNVKHMHKIEHQQDYADKLLAILFNLRGRRKERDVLRKCIRAWHSIISRDRWVDVMGDHLLTERRNKLLRRAFLGWRNEAGCASRDRRIENISTTHEAEVSRMRADADLTISALKVELLGCKDTIARGNEERAILEERLKAAVMRGMCALNAEATMVLRGMAGQSQQHMMSMGMNENVPPPPPPPQQQQQQQFSQSQNQNPYNYYQTQPLQQQQQPSTSATYTDQLLSMQGQINNQLNQYQPPSAGSMNNNNNNNNSSYGSGGVGLNDASGGSNRSYGANAATNNNMNTTLRNSSRSTSLTPTDNVIGVSSTTALPPRRTPTTTTTQNNNNNQRPASTTSSNVSNSLVSFNAEHPAYTTSGTNNNNNVRPLTASNRSTPSRR